MKSIALLFTAAILSGFFAFGCSKTDGDQTFQQTEPNDTVMLFEVLNESPALKSAFSNLEPREFNRKMNDLMFANPDLLGELMVRTGEALYLPETPGAKAIFPETVDKLSKSFNSFHDAYMRDPDSLDTTVDIVKAILDLDPTVMSEGAGVIMDLLVALRNWDDVNSDGGYWVDANGNALFDSAEAYDPAETSAYPWRLFGQGQELESIGYAGVNTLIENISFARTLYGDGEGLQDLSTIIRKSIESVIEEHWDIEQKMFSFIDYLETNDPFTGITAIEKEIADWMAPGADPLKYSIGEYLINDLFPKVQRPVFDIVTDGAVERSIDVLESGKKFLNDESLYLSESAKRRSRKYNIGPDAAAQSNDDGLYSKWFLGALYHDMDWYDRLEDVPLFDFVNNDILRWLKGDAARRGVVPRWNTVLANFPQDRMTDLLWNGHTYSPTAGASTFFPGLVSPGGAVTALGRVLSSDALLKPFRRQVNDILNSDGLGGYDDNANGTFKTVGLSYSSTGNDRRPENIIESVMTNLKFYTLSSYYKASEGKWAFGPEDGQAFFGDPNRNLQTLFGTLTTNIRNLVILDRDGKDPRVPGYTGNGLSLLTNFVYLFAAGGGMVDPNNAKTELSLRNVLNSLGSPLRSRNYLNAMDYVDDSIDWLLELFGSWRVYCLEDATIRRSPSYGYHIASGSIRPNTAPPSWTTFSSQYQMPVMEVLQPGTFRQRVGSNNPGAALHGVFSPSQGDLFGITRHNPATGNDVLNTSDWLNSEIALACWEGYGPYTYLGKAPNGSECKYRNDWYTDWYQMIGMEWGNKGPGLKYDRGRYHYFEAIYKPTHNSRYGYFRKSSPVGMNITQDGSYANAVNPDDPGTYDRQVVLDCATREEAMRKNFQWLLNYKKYVYLLPIHGMLDKDIITIPLINKSLCNIKTEIYTYVTINFNGIGGAARGRRHQAAPNDKTNNAVWSGGIEHVYDNTMAIDSNHVVNDDAGNPTYPVKLIEESNATFRMAASSFRPQDFCVAMEYDYSSKITLLFDLIPLPDNMSAGILSMLLSIVDALWSAVGNGSILPAVIGDNLQALITLGDSVYSARDVLGAASPTSDAMTKFNEFYRTYYTMSYVGPGATAGTLIYRDDNGREQSIKEKDLPRIPRVAGVSYPTSFTDSGQATAWRVYEGETEGKFDLFVALYAAIQGTLHEDGRIMGFDGVGNVVPADYSAIDRGVIAYYDRDGYRTQINDFVMTVCALNEARNAPGGTAPIPDPSSLLNLLVDRGGMAGDAIGARNGVLSYVIESTYANLNNLNPIKESVEGAVRNVVRNFLNNGGNFRLTATGADAPLPYYVTREDGTRAVSNRHNWETPINKLRYFTDNESLRRLEESLDLLRDVSRSDEFKEMLRKTIIALDNFLIVKHIDEQYRTCVKACDCSGIEDEPARAACRANYDACTAGCVKMTRVEALNDGVLQLYTPLDDAGNQLAPGAANYDAEKAAQLAADIQKAADVLIETDYHQIIDFIKRSGINDIEKLYNFSFDNWSLDATGLTMSDVRKNIDDINATLVKLAGVNLKEGLIDGIYRLRNDAGTVVPDPRYFKRGDTIYGFGTYVEITQAEYQNGEAPADVTYVDFTDGEGALLRYYRYIDIRRIMMPSGVLDDEHYSTDFGGITAYFDFRNDGTLGNAYSELCDNYRDPWYRAGTVDCPNVFNPHKYDINMEGIFGGDATRFAAGDFATVPRASRVLTDFTAGITDENGMPLAFDRPHRYYRPTTFIDTLYRWGDGLDIETELDYAKDSIIHSVYEEREMEVPELLRGYFTSTDYRDETNHRASIRTVIQKSRGVMIEKAYDDGYDYDMNPGNGAVTHYVAQEPAGARHRHKLNNIADIIAILLNPGDPDHPDEEYRTNPHFLTGRINTAWNAFINSPSIQDITTDDLVKVRSAVASLLYNSDESCQTCDDRGENCRPCTRDDRYSRLFTNLTANLPKLLRKYQLTVERDGDVYMQYGDTLYDELAQLGLVAFSPDGVGTYLFENIRPAAQFTAWNMTEEIDSLLRKDIFTTSSTGTFWFEIGHLIQSFGIILKQREIVNGEMLDYYSSFRGMFE
ncbi:MAG TPA: hypothetical protein PKJ16_01985 [Spirochaetota bacterium]|nr:hypothetical protein [Spirochaetota bacterium]